MKFGIKLNGGWNDCFIIFLKLSGYLMFIKDKQNKNCKADRILQNNPEKNVAIGDNTEIKLEVVPIELDAEELAINDCCSFNE